MKQFKYVLKQMFTKQNFQHRTHTEFKWLPWKMSFRLLQSANEPVKNKSSFLFPPPNLFIYLFNWNSFNFYFLLMHMICFVTLSIHHSTLSMPYKNLSEIQKKNIEKSNEEWTKRIEEDARKMFINKEQNCVEE